MESSVSFGGDLEFLNEIGEWDRVCRGIGGGNGFLAVRLWKENLWHMVEIWWEESWDGLRLALYFIWKAHKILIQGHYRQKKKNEKKNSFCYVFLVSNEPNWFTHT